MENSYETQVLSTNEAMAASLIYARSAPPQMAHQMVGLEHGMIRVLAGT